MKRTHLLISALAICACSSVFAADDAADPNPSVANADGSEVKTLPQVDSQDKNHNANSLSSTLERGMDNQGLTMEEKWSDDVIVCKKEKMSGSRVTRKVCHSRGEWRAMRENGREVTREVQRRDRGPNAR